MDNQDTTSELDQGTLAKELATDLAQYRPRRTQRYESVYVLILTWKDLKPEDALIAAQADQIGALFRDKFNCSIHPYGIPSQRSESSLAVHVAMFVNCYGDQPDNLIIVYLGATSDCPKS
ncbi:hypothetical protein QBC44DRAFT_374510 [Cladorrhinum sp. PSN332]|nr:hypothetical protein QBC44DRAFT_374510 [Cladorrhinum sp. PSN332]